ncbi:MAG: T9SS type A sorting domain-containing protein [Candidatus Azobacteroides sp.]|nr:T9SS type A sorting domain-containing protein [Candidatus Azobacteroides sp.]
MKRLFTLLLIALGVTPLLFSQVTMTKADHGFLSGLSHECVAVQYQSPGESGKNCVWDFSKATLLNDDKSIATLSDDAGRIKASRNDGCEFFFNITENANEYWGYKTGNASLQLTEPIVKTKYPQTYGTQFSGKYAGTYTVGDKNYTGRVEGTYSTYADAIGVIILPGDVSFSALRVKTTEGTASFERVKYLWYAQEVRLPLFVTMEDYSIAADGTRKLLIAQSYLNTQAKNPAVVRSSADTFLFQVFPNPFRDKIQLSYTLTEKALVTVTLYAPGGAQLTTLVSQVQSGTQTLSKDVSKYTQQPGVYLLKITVGDKIYTEKLVKAY